MMRVALAIVVAWWAASPAWAGRERPGAAASEPAERPVLDLRVTLSDGSPAVRAAVTMDGLARGRTGPDGRLELAVHAAGHVAVIGVATTDGGAPESALVTMPVAAGRQVVTVVLVPEVRHEVAVSAPVVADAVAAPPPSGPAVLTVWALDHRGQALPDADVVVDGARAGVTGPNGSLRLPARSPGRSVTIRVESPLRATAHVARFTLTPGPQARTVVLTPLDTDGDGIPDLDDACPEEPEVRNGYRDDDGCPDRLGALSVLVLDPDRFPVVGAALRVDGEVVGLTGADGRARASDLMPETTVSLVASLDDPGLAPGRPVAFEVAQGDQTATVVLERSALAKSAPPELAIVALDVDGAPVPLATVIVDDRYRGRTGEDGRYVYTGRPPGTDVIVGVTAPFREREISALRLVRLDGGPQTVRIWLDGSDGGVGALAQEDPDGDGRIDAFDLCPYEPETYNGYKDDDGCPDALATVHLRVVDTEGQAVAGAAVTLDGEGVGATDATGHLVLPEATPGFPVDVTVAAPGGDVRAARTRWADLEEGVQERVVTLSVIDTDGDGIRDSRDACPDAPETYNGYQDDDGCPDKLAALFLTVVDDAGERVPGVAVIVSGLEVGRTDASGWLEIPDLVPGEGVSVEVRAAGGTESLKVDLVEGAQRRRVVLGASPDVVGSD